MSDRRFVTHRSNGAPLLFDPWLLLSTLCLVGIGLLIVASSSSMISERNFGYSYYFVVRQGIFLLLGCAVALFALRVEMKTWQRLGPILLVVSLALLVMVMIPGIGREVNGSMRWIKLGPISVQISEIAKFSMVIYIAGYLVRHNEEVRTRLSGFIKPMCLMIVIAFLLLMQPDFGATTVIFATVLGLLFLAGVRLLPFVVLFLVGVSAMALLAISSPYRLERLTTFLDPWARQYDSGYQLTQSLIAFGRGSLFGVGLGDSVQKLFYLPEAHTDFLFAVLAEELGLVGGLVVIFLFIVLIFRGLYIGRKTQLQGNLFAGFVAYGLSIWFGLQAMINLGVSMGALPTKGLTLPLMSYGGSGIIINLLMIALLLRIDYESRCVALGLRDRDD